MTKPFHPIGEAADNVLMFTARKKLLAELETSLQILDAKLPDQSVMDATRDYELRRAKNLITHGLGLIQQHDSPQAAIKYLQDVLAIISGAPCND